jgi:hypothetical protein
MKTEVRLYLAEFILEWEMFQAKVVEKIKTHFVSSNFFSRNSCRLWHRPQMKIRRMRFRHSEHATLIAFPRQEWLRERALMLRLYVHCLLFSSMRVKGLTYRVELIIRIILTKIMNYDGTNYTIFSSHFNVLSQGSKYSWHRLVTYLSYRPSFAP